MDEQDQEARIAAAFRDAAAHAPPPGFDATDVVATSRRITRRRRSALAGGALAVLAVAGIGIAGLGSRSGAELTTASAGSAQGADSAGGSADDGGAAAPEAARAAAPEAPGGPVAPAPVAAPAHAPAADARAAGSAAGSAAPLGPGTGECGARQDPALRALVEQALPEAVGAPEAVTSQECRPGGERGVALEVRDGASSGVLTVSYLPPGEMPSVAQGVRSARTASGGTVLVFTGDQAGGQAAPFAGRLDAVVAYLAPRL